MQEHRLASAILCAWLMIWAVVHAQLAWQTTPSGGVRSFNSPDEAANFYFANRVADGQTIAAAAPLGDAGGGIVHPRSTAIFNGRLVPLSFLGLPYWYGIAGRVVGSSLVYLTPLLAVVGGLALYRLLRRIFGHTVALLTVALLPMVPPWWYYSARSMFHNLPFLALTLVGLAAVASVHRHGRRGAAAIAGVSLGLALAFRTVEAFWLAPLLLLTFVLCPGRYKRRWWLVAAGVIAVWLPILVQQAATFGHPFRFGYLLPPAGDDVASAAAQRSVSDLIPFGLHPRRAWSNAWRFIVQMFPWIFWPAALGMVTQLISWRALKNVRRWYIAGYLGVSALLVLYYGSAQLADNLNPAAVTLGMSYVRYWLPVYVGMLPFTILGVQWLAARVHAKFFRRLIGGGLLLAIAGLSIRMTLNAPQEGLRQVRQAVIAGYAKRAAVASRVPSDAVMVAERSDKLFFPTFPVVSTLMDPTVQQNLPALVAVRPVYYYTFLDDFDLAALQTQLARYRLQLSLPTVIDRDAPSPERLMQITVRTP
ncbi:MAG: glycosyltransferase family 39 protein [Patescibacteria group bacterium]|nr:glycosyltransferase family 39 protein [Patescibacteria group bacterium]